MNFELFWKTLQSHIENQGFDYKSPKSCIKEGIRLEIIKNLEDWFECLKARHLIACTYNEKMANKVCYQAKKFLQKIDSFLNALINDDQSKSII